MEAFIFRKVVKEAGTLMAEFDSIPSHLSPVEDRKHSVKHRKTLEECNVMAAEVTAMQYPTNVDWHNADEAYYAANAVDAANHAPQPAPEPVG